MDVTLQDLLNLGVMKGLKLIAGEKGLSRKITSCGILDYELDRSLKDRYFHSNFHEHQFALTSLLYAKDEEHLIIDAIKYLVNKNACGVAIKNVYKLPIHDSALRYAESLDFPIFIIEDTNVYFENFIISVTNSINMLENSYYGQKEIDTILYKSLDPIKIRQHVLEINPSLKNHFFVMYFYSNQHFDNHQFYKIQHRFKNSQFHLYSHSLLRYNKGFLLLYSKDFIDSNDIDILFKEIIHTFIEPTLNMLIGISDLHYRLEEMKQAIQEAFFAALLHQNFKIDFIKYDDIGTYKAVFPFAKTDTMQKFSQQCLKPIIEFDAENNLSLFDTLIEFIKCNGNLQQLSIQSSLHENTIRYRLNKITQLTSLDFKKPEHFEQLSLAVKIYICTELLNEFGLYH